MAERNLRERSFGRSGAGFFVDIQSESGGIQTFRGSARGLQPHLNLPALLISSLVG